MDQLLNSIFTQNGARITRKGEDTFAIRIVAKHNFLRETWINRFLDRMIKLCGGASVTEGLGYYANDAGEVEEEISALVETECERPDEIFCMLANMIHQYMIEEDQETVFLQIGLHIIIATSAQVINAKQTLKKVKEVM